MHNYSTGSVNERLASVNAIITQNRNWEALRKSYENAIKDYDLTFQMIEVCMDVIFDRITGSFCLISANL